jgi:hypothetical protein
LPDSRRIDGTAFLAGLMAFERRFKTASFASASLVASAAATIVFVGWPMLGGALVTARVAAGLAFAAVLGGAAMAWTRRWTPQRVAAAIEARTGGLDNIVVTATEHASGSSRRLHDVVGAALWHDASERLRGVTPQKVQPLAALVATAVAAVLAAAIFVGTSPGQSLQHAAADAVNQQAANAVPGPGDLRVDVEPPAYSGRKTESLTNPAELAVLDGSRVRLSTSGASGQVQLVEPGRAPQAFDKGSDGWRHEFVAHQSRVLLVQGVAGDGASGRLLQIRVDADRRPLIRIQQPGKDLVVPDATGAYAVEMEAEDDVGLESVVLRYTRVAGSGEAFTFEEGDIPIRVQAASTSSWKATATLALASLKLEDGDTLVYRALAKDRKPGAEPSASETFLIEVGRVGGVASTGFAVPEERDRQALSQQMLIMKTERLHASRTTLAAEAVLEQSRLLAIEQRMVKAEFVFMTGGHVEDEVAEAEAGHELAEGRQENQSQVDLLAAIREMSRAEARLNAGETAAALVFERAALRALQRAFDRRRYLLRTLPERARIDLTRRLTGNMKDARSTGREPRADEPDRSALAARETLLALGRGIRDGALDAALAARVLSIDPQSADLRRAALTFASAGEPAARIAAARDAQRLLAAFLAARVGAPPRGAIDGDPLRGPTGPAPAGGTPR